MIMNGSYVSSLLRAGKERWGTWINGACVPDFESRFFQRGGYIRGWHAVALFVYETCLKS